MCFIPLNLKKGSMHNIKCLVHIETDWFKITEGDCRATLLPYPLYNRPWLHDEKSIKRTWQPCRLYRWTNKEQAIPTDHNKWSISDLDFADDIALILNHIDEAQCRLQSVVNVATNLRLHLNAVKTQAIVYNRDPTVIKTKSNDSIRNVADFKYLGSWINKWFCKRHENKKSSSLGGV